MVVQLAEWEDCLVVRVELGDHLVGHSGEMVAQLAEWEDCLVARAALGDHLVGH